MKTKRKMIGKMKNNHTFQQALNKIKSCSNIGIVGHINPDGDSIGSLLAMGMALKQINDKNISMIIEEDIPKIYRFLPGTDEIRCSNQDEEFDLLITLDCSDFSRVGIDKSIIAKSSYIISLDHHKSNDYFGDMNFVYPNISSTGEIVYNFLSSMKFNITKEIATCLYVSISTDTGSFKYDNTSPDTHEIIADLMRKKIDLNVIATNVYQSKSLERTKLFIESINGMELYFSNRFGIVTVTQDIINKCNATIQDVEGIIEFVRDIDTVTVACILKELEDEVIKVGFRSKNDIDVADIAQIFGGGGHARAAGCTIYATVEKAKEMILNEIQKVIR